MSTPTRVALVMGGSGGIGRTVVERLAADGMAVGVHYAGNRDAADEAVKAIEAAGGRAITVTGDVADERETAAVFDAMEAVFGGIDVVVNAAGILALSPLATFDLDVLDRMHRTNIRGAFVVAQQAARRARAGGAIIGFSTSQTRMGFPGYSAYAASKAAVETMTFVLAREMRGRDVTVNAVAPGPTATAMFLEGKDRATIDRLMAQPPLERLGTPADIADVVSFLAGPARWINGQVIYANGGIA
ncbi:SDR family oxidoreductase [Nonomuraea aridisoli]|uniref:3-ketoacyl-ACP reductase n=1 Tax=Nonomuraea aridisoli TaxID=2070368 RepID=A0A2W2DY49_9ACTN|nr:SDR family oxidoreductase [Nonomuraea aridisoli]PZG16846.1 3-ketoacyl-ACP reductase [Nonomuraea aridisoli]